MRHAVVMIAWHAFLDDRMRRSWNRWAQPSARRANIMRTSTP
jgi:hypothetical protein